jgi:hypothetical protein
MRYALAAPLALLIACSADRSPTTTSPASSAAQGTNRPPIVRIGGPRPPDPAPSNTFFSIAGGQPTDPDGDEPDNGTLCRTATVVATGACSTSGRVLCGGAGDTFDFDFRTLAGPGTCVLEARASDSWGAVGTDRLSFAVSPP